MLGRHPRQRGPPLRARLLDPAPAPEGAGGGARADAQRRHPPAGARVGRRPGRARRLRQRRHRRVPARRRHRRGLLPGDEHPAPGRAPGHRVGRHRHRAAAGDGPPAPVDLVALQLRSPPASRCRSPRTTCRVERARHRGAGLRRGPVPRLPAPGRHRHPGPLAGRGPRRRRAGVRQRRQHVVRPDARQGHRHRSRPRVGPPGPGRGPRRHRDPRADHQPRLPAGAGRERRVPRRHHRHRVARHRRGAGARRATTPRIFAAGSGDAGGARTPATRSRPTAGARGPTPAPTIVELDRPVRRRPGRRDRVDGTPVHRVLAPTNHVLVARPSTAVATRAVVNVQPHIVEVVRHGPAVRLRATRRLRRPRARRSGDGTLLAPMPGTVLDGPGRRGRRGRGGGRRWA